MLAFPAAAVADAPTSMMPRSVLARLGQVRARGIYVETVIAAGIDQVWQATQDPVSHVRWDVRFSEIHAESGDDDEAVRFTYVRRSVLHDVHGFVHRDPRLPGRGSSEVSVL